MMMKGNYQAKNGDCFFCVKVTMIVLYVLSLMACVIMAGLSVVALVAVTHPEETPNAHFTHADLEVMKKALIYALVATIVSSIFTVVGLVGVIKEHRVIMIIMTVMGLLELICYLAQSNWFAVYLEVLVTLMTGGYTYMLVRRNYNSPSQTNIAL